MGRFRRGLEMQLVTFGAQIIEQETFNDEPGSKITTITEENLSLVRNIMPREMRSRARDCGFGKCAEIQDKPCPTSHSLWIGVSHHWANCSPVRLVCGNQCDCPLGFWVIMIFSKRDERSPRAP